MPEFIPTPHPVLKLPTRDQASAMGQAKTMEMLKRREELIRLEKEDPYRFGFRFDCWKDADRLLQDLLLLCIFGGNGSGKTFYGARKGVEVMLNNPGAAVLFLHESDASSVDIQQKAVWHYLPRSLRETKYSRSSIANITYSVKNGFTENKGVLPNASWFRFGSYKQDLSDYEGHGWKLIVADENMPLAWLKTLLFRLPRANGQMIWLFTPVYGITPAIKHVTEGARTIESRPAELLPQNQVLVDGCPPGHMPYIQEAIKPRTKLMYFFSEMNPYSNYAQMRELVMPLDKEQKERRAYGYARNVKGRLFPLFGKVHVIPHDRIPTKDVTCYHFADPAGARNMFMIWVKVDAHRRHFIYREWPDVEHFGEWAVESENSNKWDGDAGPAQPTMGYGIVKYKELILAQEGNERAGDGWKMCGEKIRERYMDSRSGAAQNIAENQGGTSLMDRMEEEQFEADTLVGPSMVFKAASGQREERGWEAINDLLFYNNREQITPLLNEPKLYISERCKNLIWAMQNYTSHDGEKAACKDPIDDARYMALADLEHFDEANYAPTGGGSY